MGDSIATWFWKLGLSGGFRGVRDVLRSKPGEEQQALDVAVERNTGWLPGQADDPTDDG